MACTSPECKKCKWGTIKMPCRVCELNENDSTAKFVCYCGVCGAYICQRHWGWNTPLARVQAAVKDTLAQTIEKVEAFVKRKRKPEEITD